MHSPRHPSPRTFLAASGYLALALIICGCSRGVYRRWADRSAQNLIEKKAERTGADSDAWAIEPNEDSRYFDPTNPDHPPMPLDDPISQELLRTKVKPGKESVTTLDTWKALLPKAGPNRYVLSLRDAVKVAARNSRNFQTAREELYLSALDLTEQRYLLAPRFNAGTEGVRGEYGPNRLGRPNGAPPRGAGLDTGAGVQWLTAWGGELLINAANTIIWDFDRPNLRTASSLLNFSFVQPLMRFGGRARTLEALTQADRHLLANVRRMEQYQQSFYLNIVSGRGGDPSPTRADDQEVSTAPNLLAGTPSGVAGVPGAAGYLGLLEEQQRIVNLESNVSGLRTSLSQFEAAFSAGRAASLLQVLQARQALLDAQSSLLTSRTGYQTRLDTFKTELGLPPELPVQLQDGLLSRFTIFDPATTALQNVVTDLATSLQDREQITTLEQIRGKVQGLIGTEGRFAERFAAAEADLREYEQIVPVRQRQFRILSQREELRGLQLDPRRFNAEALGDRAGLARERLQTLRTRVESAFAELAQVDTEIGALELDQARSRASAAASSLTGYVLQLSLDHAGSRLETVTLPASDLDAPRALEIARTNRLDWMNARAEVVDAWRKIDYHANPLMSGVDLILNADLGTTRPRGPGSATSFDARNSGLSGGLRFDTPLDRLRERNDYRTSLVVYQRARRDYMLFEDRVSQSLRNTLRLIQLSQLNFELRRFAVRSALEQVDLARLRLDEPPRPGQTSQIGVTAARDLVSALSDLLDAQNSFLSLWVGSEVLRMVLDYELGLMEIGSDGLWLEPGPFTRGALQKRLAERAVRHDRLPAPFSVSSSGSKVVTKVTPAVGR